MSNVIARYAARDAKRRARENDAKVAQLQPLIETAVAEKNAEIAALKEKIAALETELATFKAAETKETTENAPVGDSAAEATPTPAEPAKAADGGKNAAQKKGK